MEKNYIFDNRTIANGAMIILVVTGYLSIIGFFWSIHTEIIKLNASQASSDLVKTVILEKIEANNVAIKENNVAIKANNIAIKEISAAIKEISVAIKEISVAIKEISNLHVSIGAQINVLENHIKTIEGDLGN